MKKTLLFCSLLAMWWFSSCKDDHPHEHNEQELITKVVLTLTKNGTVAAKATFSDKDGIGGAAPVIEGLTLEANTTYEGKIEFFDESKNPVEDVTKEILKERESHQVFYVPIPADLLTITYKDRDVNNLPVGLVVEIKTGSTGSGELTVILKHDLNKRAPNPIATGETDVEVKFPVVIN